MQGLERLLACCADVLLKLFNPNKYLHQVMQTLALFSSVTMILTVRTPYVPIPFI